MSVLVKICGINSAESADAAVRAGADFVGLVFHPRSPRNLGLDAARVLAERMRGRVKIVALFSDPRDETLADVMAAVQPDLVQLHGSETVERVSAIVSRFGRPVIKAISVAEASDLSAAARYQEAADMLLFDAKPPGDATHEGGHGAAFDWQLLRGRIFARPWLLAGGLNARNVARAVQISGALGVDVSSGVESAPGVKDAQMIRDFVAAARATHSVTEGASA